LGAKSVEALHDGEHELTLHTLQSSVMMQEAYTAAKAYSAAQIGDTGDTMLRAFLIIFAIFICWCTLAFLCIQKSFPQETKEDVPYKGSGEDRLSVQSARAKRGQHSVTIHTITFPESAALVGDRCTSDDASVPPSASADDLDGLIADSLEGVHEALRKDTLSNRESECSLSELGEESEAKLETRNCPSLARTAAQSEAAESAMARKESQRPSLSGTMRRPEDLLASANPELAVKLGLRHSWIDKNTALDDTTSSSDIQPFRKTKPTSEVMEEVQAIRKNHKNATLELLRASGKAGSGTSP